MNIKLDCLSSSIERADIDFFKKILKNQQKQECKKSIGNIKFRIGYERSHKTTENHQLVITSNLFLIEKEQLMKPAS